MVFGLMENEKFDFPALNRCGKHADCREGIVMTAENNFLRAPGDTSTQTAYALRSRMENVSRISPINHETDLLSRFSCQAPRIAATELYARSSRGSLHGCRQNRYATRSIFDVLLINIQLLRRI